VTAAVHLALPLYPHHGALVNAGFVAAGVGYAALARRAHLGRRWRLASAGLVVANLVGYLVVLGRGEEADQVGVATAMVELTILGLAMVPATRSGARRFAGASTTVFATVLVGVVVWATSFAAHAETTQDEATPNETEEHHHHDGRTQAGMLMRPLGEAHHPTEADGRAAADLAVRTRDATARYADLGAALADGYRGPLTGMHGTDVHLENPAYKKDGAVLDPLRPEMLVYAIDGGRATLLGVVYVMERAGTPGPQPGGPITRWHAHNLCAGALPPGLGVVSPYGGCPAFSVAVASPEMMHVWVVDDPSSPDGAFAEGLDANWVRAVNAQHGLPWPR
jgi:hypothetical protein